MKIFVAGAPWPIDSVVPVPFDVFVSATFKAVKVGFVYFIFSIVIFPLHRSNFISII